MGNHETVVMLDTATVEKTVSGISLPTLVEGRIYHNGTCKTFRAVKHGTRKWRITSTDGWMPIKSSPKLWTSIAHAAAYTARSKPGTQLQISYLTARNLPIIPPADKLKLIVGTRWIGE